MTQSTGEDWNNVSLTLSTIASDTFGFGKRIPELRPIKLRQQPKGQAGGLFNNNFNNRGFVPHAGAFGQKSNIQQASNVFGQAASFAQPVQVPQQTSLFGQAQPAASLFGSAPAAVPFGSTSGAPAGGAFGFGAVPSSPPAPAPPPSVPAVAERERERAEDYDQEDFEEVNEPATITEPTTIVSETPVAVSFSVHGESSIPSDGIEHQVSVAMLPFKAKVSYITVPRIDPRVFLQVRRHVFSRLHVQH